MTHLWEVDHAYYCEESNFFTTSDRTVTQHRSWADFMASESDSDMDYNLVFRWDWKTIEDEGTGENGGHPADDYYRGYHLYLFFMGQRKGLYRSVIVDVCRADEADVIAWLRPRYEHLMSLWEPFAPVPADDRGED